MKVFYNYQYAQPNSGIQLRVDFDQYNTGYASYFPWTNLDQPPITKVIDEFKTNNLSSISSHLIYRCWFDRFCAQNNMKSQTPYMNHSFVMGEKVEILNERLLKLKLSGDINHDIRLVQKYSKDFTLRLDANFKYTFNDFVLFCNEISQASIDYIEDPIPWDHDIYLKLSNKLDRKIAIDHPFNLQRTQAIQYTKILKNNLRNYYPDRSQSDQRLIHSSNLSDSHSNWLDYMTLIHQGSLDETQKWIYQARYAKSFRYL